MTKSKRLGLAAVGILLATSASALVYGVSDDETLAGLVTVVQGPVSAVLPAILPTPTPTQRALVGSQTGLVAQAWLTTGDQRSLLALQAPIPFYSAAGSGNVIVVDPSVRYQTIEGFGASITDASAYLIQHALGPNQRTALMNDLFGAGGNHFGMTRLTLGASDFSATHYSYDDLPAGQTDPALAQFSIAPATLDVLPTVRAAKVLNPDLVVMGTPWSPPGWMKTSGSLIGGTLRDDSFHVFGAYLAKTAHAFASAGVPLDYMSIQNEPAFAPTDYPGMLLSPDQRAALFADHVGPQLADASPQTKLLELDHNWDLNPQALQVLSNTRAAQYVSGSAFHCYGGDVSQQSIVHNQFPAKDVFFTECVGSATAINWASNLGYDMQNLIIGTTRNWARGVAFFNIALDTTFGPHKGGCVACTGIVTVEPITGTYSRNVQYYSLGHLSRFVQRGAVRIASTERVDNVLSVAFANPDGTVALLAYNTDSADHDPVISTPYGAFTFHLKAQSAVTFKWRAPA